MVCGGRVEGDARIRVVAAHERRVLEAEGLQAPTHGRLQAAVQEVEPVLRVEGVAERADRHRRCGVRPGAEVLLPLHLVAGAEGVGSAEDGIEPRLQRIGAAVVVTAVAGGGLERTAAERAVEERPVRVDAGIADPVGGVRGHRVLHGGAPDEERGLPVRVGVVLARDEGGAACLVRLTRLEARELVGCERAGRHDAAGREVVGHRGRKRGALGQAQVVPGIPDAAGRGEPRREVVPDGRLRRDALVGVLAAHALRHVDVGHRGAVGEPVVGRAAADAGYGPDEPQSAALDEDVALRRAGPGAGGDVDDPRHGARAVERRPGAAQHLDPFRIDRGQALEERSGVALRARGVAEAHAVDQQRGVVAAQAAGLDGRVAPRPAERLHPDSGNRADRLGDRQLVPERDLLGVDDVDRLGDLLNRQGRRRRRDDDLGRDAGNGQREIENLRAGDGHHGGAGQRTSRGPALEDVLAARDVAEDVLPVGAGDALPELTTARALVEQELGAWDDASLRVDDAA